MSLKWLLGGEVNHKFIEKQNRKLQEQEQERFAITLKGWKKSTNPIEFKIKELIKNYSTPNERGWSQPDYPRRFFFSHPELVPYDLKMFVIILLPTIEETEKDRLVFKIFTSSKSDIKIKLKIVLDAEKDDLDNGFVKRFFLRHSELLPSELNPFIKKQTNPEYILIKKQKYIDELINWNKDLQEQNQELVNENKELKQKIKKYHQNQ